MPEQPRRFDQRRYAAPGPAPAPAPIVRRPHRARAGHATGGLPRTAGPAARREPLRGRVRLRAGLGHLRRTGGLRVGAGDRLLEGERGARAPERNVLARHQRRGPRLFGGHLPTCHRRLRHAVEPRWARGHSGPALDRRHGQGARPGTDAEPRSHPGVLETGRDGVQGQRPRRLRSFQRAVSRQQRRHAGGVALLAGRRDMPRHELSGVQYAARLSHWLANKPSDPLNNLAASWHIYNFSWCNTIACWDADAAPVAQQVPLVLGELGQNDGASAFVTALMDWMDARQGSYLAWVWDVWHDWSDLITSYDGTPTGYGQTFRTRFGS